VRHPASDTFLKSQGNSGRCAALAPEPAINPVKQNHFFLIFITYPKSIGLNCCQVPGRTPHGTLVTEESFEFTSKRFNMEDRPIIIIPTDLWF